MQKLRNTSADLWVKGRPFTMTRPQCIFNSVASKARMKEMNIPIEELNKNYLSNENLIHVKKKCYMK